MTKRFGAAATTAVVLHATLLALTLHRARASRALNSEAPPSATELELFMFATDDASSASRAEQPSSVGEASDSQAHSKAAGPERHRLSSNGTSEAEAEPARAGDSDATLTELDAGSEPGASDGASESNESARPRVELGLSGTLLRQAVLDGRGQAPRAPRRRQVFALGHWSENTVRAVAQKSAPWDGRALLTLEWDATGQLLSVTSSGASSHGDEWQRLAKDLRSQLAARPNGSPQGRGLRVVYLIKSDIELPKDKRSSLPTAKYASAEQLRENNLPPANAVSLGVKANGSASSTRVVSVELVRSDTL